MIQVVMKKSAGGSWLSREIDHLSGGNGYCHVSLCFEELGLVFEASDECGVRFRERAIDPQRECGYQLDLTDDEYRAVLKACCQMAGDGYDFGGLFNFEISIVKEDPDKEFCSEAVVKAMHAAGYLTRWEASKISPNKFSTFLKDGSLPVLISAEEN